MKIFRPEPSTHHPKASSIANQNSHSLVLLLLGFVHPVGAELPHIASPTEAVRAALVRHVNLVTGCALIKTGFGTAVQGCAVPEHESSLARQSYRASDGQLLQRFSSFTDMRLIYGPLEGDGYPRDVTLRFTYPYFYEAKFIKPYYGANWWIPEYNRYLYIRELRLFTQPEPANNFIRAYFSGKNARHYLQFKYSDGRLRLWTNDNQQTRITYDASGTLSTIEDPYGNVTSYTITAELITITHAGKMFFYRFHPTLNRLESIGFKIGATETPLYQFFYNSAVVGSYGKVCGGKLWTIQRLKDFQNLYFQYPACNSNRGSGDQEVSITKTVPIVAGFYNGAAFAYAYPNATQVGASSYKKYIKLSFDTSPVKRVQQILTGSRNSATDGILKYTMSYADSLLPLFPTRIEKVIDPVGGGASTYRTDIAWGDQGFPATVQNREDNLTIGVMPERGLNYFRDLYDNRLEVTYDDYDLAISANSYLAASLAYQYSLAYDANGYLSIFTRSRGAISSTWNWVNNTFGDVTQFTDEYGKITTVSYYPTTVDSIFRDPAGFRGHPAIITLPSGDQYVILIESFGDRNQYTLSYRFAGTGRTKIVQTWTHTLRDLIPSFKDSWGPDFQELAPSGSPSTGSTSELVYNPGDFNQWRQYVKIPGAGCPPGPGPCADFTGRITFNGVQVHQWEKKLNPLTPLSVP